MFESHISPLSHLRPSLVNMDVTIVPGGGGDGGGISVMGMQLLGNKSHQCYQCSSVI